MVPEKKAEDTKLLLFFFFLQHLGRRYFFSLLARRRNIHRYAGLHGLYMSWERTAEKRKRKEEINVLYDLYWKTTIFKWSALCVWYRNIRTRSTNNALRESEQTTLKTTCWTARARASNHDGSSLCWEEDNFLGCVCAWFVHRNTSPVNISSRSRTLAIHTWLHASSVVLIRAGFCDVFIPEVPAEKFCTSQGKFVRRCWAILVPFIITTVLVIVIFVVVGDGLVTLNIIMIVTATHILLGWMAYSYLLL